MKPDFSWLFFLVGGWIGFLAGVLFYHWAANKNKKESIPPPNKKPNWCEYSFECTHHVCKTMSDECQFDNRIDDGKSISN